MDNRNDLGANIISFLLLPSLIALTALQSRFFAYAPVGENGVVIEILTIVTLAWALWRGGAPALFIACTAGLLIDLNSIVPLGVNALALLLAVCVILPLRTLLAHSRLVAPLLLTLLGLVVWQVVHHLALIVSGYDIGRAFALMPERIGVHALAIMLLYWGVRGVGRLFGTRQGDLS